MDIPRHATCWLPPSLWETPRSHQPPPPMSQRPSQTDAISVATNRPRASAFAAVHVTHLPSTNTTASARPTLTHCGDSQNAPKNQKMHTQATRDRKREKYYTQSIHDKKRRKTQDESRSEAKKEHTHTRAELRVCSGCAHRHAMPSVEGSPSGRTSSPHPPNIRPFPPTVPRNVAPASCMRPCQC